MQTYAYIRVSTKEQNVDRQMLALKDYNLPRSHIFCDYQSGNYDEKTKQHTCRIEKYIK